LLKRGRNLARDGVARGEGVFRGRCFPKKGKRNFPGKGVGKNNALGGGEWGESLPIHGVLR